MRSKRRVRVFVRDRDAIFYDGSSLATADQVTLETQMLAMNNCSYVFDADTSLRSQRREAGKSICCRL